MVNPIRYEYWREEEKWYGQIFSNLLQKDLKTIRGEISKRISENKRKEIRWLDIGTGNGETLKALVKNSIRKKKIRINLTVIEPSKYSTSLIKRTLDTIPNIRYKIINGKFKPKIINEKFDCISILHTLYFLATTKEEFKKIYKYLYSHLNKKGILIIQTIANDSVFQKIGKPRYSLFSLGDKVYQSFKEIGENPKFKKLPTRFKIDSYLGKLTETKKERLLHLYRFMTKRERANPTKREFENFVSKMRSFSRRDRGGTYLDFKDCIISIQKRG